MKKPKNKSDESLLNKEKKSDLKDAERILHEIKTGKQKLRSQKEFEEATGIKLKTTTGK